MTEDVRAHYVHAFGPDEGFVRDAADLSVSGDGRIAFTGTIVPQLSGRAKSRVCIADIDSGRIEILDLGPYESRSPKWSPDGRTLAFLSDRVNAGLFQLHMLSWEDGNSTRSCPVIPGNVEYFSWSPDGARILLGAASEGTDVAGSEGSGITPTQSKTKQHWEPTVDRGSRELFGRSLWIYDARNDGIRKLECALQPWEASWCGPGSLLAILSDGASENAWYRPYVGLIDPNNGDVRVIRRPRRQAGIPVGNHSGRFCAWVEAACSDRKVIAGDVVLYDVSQERIVNVDTHVVDATDLAWIDSESLFFIGQRRLDTVAGVYCVNEGKTSELWCTDETCGKRYPAATPIDRSRFVAVVQSYDRAPTISRVNRGALEQTIPLEHGGTEYIRRVAGRLERFQWTARDGLEIEGLLARPEGDGPHPLVLAVHGGPIFAWRNTWSMMSTLTPLLVKQGYAVLHSNPRGSSGRGQRFAELIIGDLCGEEIHDHLRGVDALVDAGIADPKRLAVVGRSHGGQVTSWIVSETDRFHAAVAISPFANFCSARFSSNMGIFFPEFLRDDDGRWERSAEKSPIYRARHVRTPLLLIAGELDRCTPASQSVEFHHALIEHDRTSELVIYPEEGHGLKSFEAQIDQDTRILNWISDYMPG